MLLNERDSTPSHTSANCNSIQTSSRDWNHPVVHVGSLLLEVVKFITQKTSSTPVTTSIIIECSCAISLVSSIWYLKRHAQKSALATN